MSFYKNFKTVVYCIAQWADKITEEELKKQIEWFQKYIGVDKVYLETYRGEFARKEQIQMIKKIFAQYNIEVSGGITTVCPDLTDDDKKRQRLFGTFCYSNKKMRDRLKEVSEYTASLFDEFIIDDFFFTQCTCDNCLKEKGKKSWKDFRLEKMMEVSKNLVLDPAKKVNPKCKVIIKYPNWRESYHETGYNPKDQRKIFDGIYTGTEARHSAQHDQHLPRYLSYSLPRYMENVARGRNGGGWFDPFDCDSMDTYLEQAYLTAFSKCKEIMMFCWPALYNNRRATPLGFQYEKIDKLLSSCGNPTGLKVYIPFNSCGDDHIEDFLGMAGIPFDPTPDFPEYDAEKCRSVFVTAAALADDDVVSKMKAFCVTGGTVLVTSNFMVNQQIKEDQLIAAGKSPETPLSELTAIKYTNRRLDADEFQADVPGTFGRTYKNSSKILSFPLLEHRNNASWTIVNGGHGEYHEGIVMYDTYGKGRIEVINLPDMPSTIKDLPAEVLTTIRHEMMGNEKIWLDSEAGLSLFTYDNDTFGLYCYGNDGCKPLSFNIHVKCPEDKAAIKLEVLKDDDSPMWGPKEIEPLFSRKMGWKSTEKDVGFAMRINPGDWKFFKIVR